MRVFPFITASLMVLSGCSDGSGGADDKTGNLTLSGIGGLSYQTRSRAGETNNSGRYEYYPGETIDFAVGDLDLASGVPVKEYLSPLQLVSEVRALLNTAVTDDQSLRSHRPVEQQVADNPKLINLTRVLLTMDSDGTIAEDDNITIDDRAVERVNALLPTLSSDIDFTVSVDEFAQTEAEATETDPATEASPINELVRQICFEPEDSSLCNEPPTTAEIEAAPEAPNDDADREEGVTYRDGLETLRSRIFNAVRTVDEVKLDEVEEYLLREVDAITVEQTNEYFLSQSTATISASDTPLKEVFVRKVNEDINLTDLEAISTNPSAVVIQSFSAQTGSVEFFVDGDAGEESTIIINFKPDDNYRWLRKPLRVIIE
jgi:hypothetical protein